MSRAVQGQDTASQGTAMQQQGHASVRQAAATLPGGGWTRQALVAIGATAVGLLARWTVDPLLGDRHEYLTVYLAVAAATWFGTWRAGALTALLSLAGTEALFGAPRSAADLSSSHSVLAAVGSALVCVIIVVSIDRAVRARTEMQQRVRDLDASDHRKSDFIALLAHELRNPLSVLSTGTILIQKGELDQRALDGAWRTLERQTEHMKRLVSDLLDTSRIEQGKLSLALENVSVGAVVAQAVADAETFLAPRRQRIVQTVAAHTGRAPADPLRLRQVLDNLLHNACKFSPEDATIHVDVQATPTEICISVRDAGVGIDAADLRAIFGSFVQAGPASARMQGLGLGLALCSKLMAMHGGSIEARSAGRGHGSEFIVRLPRPPELAACTAAAASS